jgi:multisubunit Na+/H+ antiporter MnhF subunit
VRRWLPQPLLSAALLVVWLLLNSTLAPAHLLLGALLAWLLPLLSAPFRPAPVRLRRPLLAARLLARVLWDIVLANIEVARRILGPEDALQPHFGRHHHADSGHGVVGSERRPALPAGACPERSRSGRPGGRHQDPLRASADGDFHVNAVHAVLPWVAGMLVLAMGFNLWRALRGPALPDRILALDTLYINALALLVLLGIGFGSRLYFEVALVIAALGFVGTVALARYVLRREVIE